MLIEIIKRELTLKNITSIVLIILLCVMFFKVTNMSNNLDKAARKQELTEKLLYALQDSMRVVTKANGEMAYERKTLQAELKDLKNQNLNLSSNQKYLLNQIEGTKNLINAGLIDIAVKLNGVYNTNSKFTNDSTVNFTHNSDSIKYNIDIKNVARYKELNPVMKFNQFEIPNKMVVDFKWGEKKEGYPVSFTVSNSNPMYKVNDIQSYVIPEIKKEDVKPTGWQKFKKKFNQYGKYVTGFGVGAGLGLLLFK
jgi:hypothetical protein